jgi:hypothetical protein
VTELSSTKYSNVMAQDFTTEKLADPAWLGCTVGGSSYTDA